MSVFNYSCELSSLENVFSIVPYQSVQLLRDDDRAFYAAHRYAEDLATFTFPTLRVTKYEPKNETIILDPRHPEEELSRPAFSDLLNDPAFTLMDVFVDCIGYLNGLFKNNDSGEFVESRIFTGLLFIESQYDGAEPKIYKFRSRDYRPPKGTGEVDSQTAEIIEIDNANHFMRRIEYHWYGLHGPDNYMEVTEFRL